MKMRFHSRGNEFNLHVNEISFSYERMGTKTRFEKEVKGNSEISGLFKRLRQRQGHDILDFAYCLGSRVLNVTLTNPQIFGFESEFYFLLLHCTDEAQPGRNSCRRMQFLAFFGFYHVVVPLTFLRSNQLCFIVMCLF